MKIIDLLTAPWAIMPDHLEEMTRIYSAHLQGEKIEALEARAAKPLANRPQGYSVHNGVAVVPIDGIIAKKMNLFHQISGGVSTQLIERDFRQAMADEKVHSIILHADTPGGSVDGTAGLAKTIFEARGTKPIVTLADGLMASAGVWIGSAADSVYMTSETTAVGSIGVVTQHVDYSEADKKRGIKVTEIFAGKYKRIATEKGPLSEEGREYLQDHVDYVYSIFVDTVAKHRGTTSADVLERMAEGRLFIGQHAISAGLVDGIATLDQLIEELAIAGDLNAAVHAKDASRSSAPVARQPNILEQLPEDLAEAYEAGVAAGAAQESDRIMAVRSLKGAFSGAHDAFVELMMFDGVTTMEKAASEIIAVEKENRVICARARAADAAAVNAIAASVELEKQRAASAESAEAQIRINWETNAGLRAEFGQNFERFRSYSKNKTLAIVESTRS